MPMMGEDDHFETRYLAQLRVLLTEHGVPLSYEKDRAAIDTGLHLFVEGPSGRQASPTRVWFQVKGKRKTTLSRAAYDSSADIEVRVPVEHVRFWYAHAEPVYLAIYIESANHFIAEDVRDIVDRQWPDGPFDSAVPESQHSVTLRVGTAAVLDSIRIQAMLAHRSMRIDGPSFRGRPLGHRFDPLRSQIAVCSPELWVILAGKILGVHEFREQGREKIAPGMEVRLGRLYQTLEWQSPMFAEYGYDYPGALRQEPSVSSIHGDVAIIVDSGPERRQLSSADLEVLRRIVRQHPEEGAIAVFFNGKERSGTRGLWRSALDQLGAYQGSRSVHLLGLESITSLLLVATLVYLDVAPELAWDHVCYQS